MPSYIRTLTIFYKNEIASHQIPQLRGAIIRSTKNEDNTLFHNHIDNNFRQKYPLIQYKRLFKKAAIVCINQGCDEITKLISQEDLFVSLGSEQVELSIEKIVPQRMLIQTWNSIYSYRLQRWLPLNTENYEKYKSIEGIAERITFLEKILTANLLSFAKGVDIHIEKEISCTITEITEPYLITYKRTKLMAFDLHFNTNIFLPYYIGLGKSVSLGYGMVCPKQEHNKQK